MKGTNDASQSRSAPATGPSTSLNQHDVAHGGDVLTKRLVCSALLPPSAAVRLLAKQRLHTHFQVALSQQRLDGVVLQFVGELQDRRDCAPPLLYLAGQVVH